MPGKYVVVTPAGPAPAERRTFTARLEAEDYHNHQPKGSYLVICAKGGDDDADGSTPGRRRHGQPAAAAASDR